MVDYMHASKFAPAADSWEILAVASYTSIPLRSMPTRPKGKPYNKYIIVYAVSYLEVAK